MIWARPLFTYSFVPSSICRKCQGGGGYGINIMGKVIVMPAVFFFKKMY